MYIVFKVGIVICFRNKREQTALFVAIVYI